MDFDVEFEQEDDGRWIAEITEIPGVLAYGLTPLQAGARARALALRVLADRMENEMSIPVFYDNEEVGSKMVARAAKHTGLKQDDL
jgi:predicted RNase H-like HicB family nuclease